MLPIVQNAIRCSWQGTSLESLVENTGSFAVSSRRNGNSEAVFNTRQ
jgi:hypothetical protein